MQRIASPERLVREALISRYGMNDLDGLYHAKIVALVIPSIYKDLCGDA